MIFTISKYLFPDNLITGIVCICLAGILEREKKKTGSFKSDCRVCFLYPRNECTMKHSPSVCPFVCLSVYPMFFPETARRILFIFCIKKLG